MATATKVFTIWNGIVQYDGAWCGKIADLVEPLAHLLLREIMISGITHLDETGYVVLNNRKKKGKKSHRGWMWAVMNPVERICCFMYHNGRGKKDIKHVLKGYQGNWLSDGHVAYIKYHKQPNVKHAKCTWHVPVTLNRHRKTIMRAWYARQGTDPSIWMQDVSAELMHSPKITWLNYYRNSGNQKLK